VALLLRLTLIYLPASGGAIVTHWILMSVGPMWWMGHCFGPRAFLNVVPSMMLLAALAWKAFGRPDDPAWGLRRPWRWTAATPVGTSVLIRAAGACCPACSEWNQTPIRVDDAPERVWAWSDPHFLAPLMRSRHVGATPRSSD
jgi:hypothetical protein